MGSMQTWVSQDPMPTTSKRHSIQYDAFSTIKASVGYKFEGFDLSL